MPNIYGPSLKVYGLGVHTVLDVKYAVICEMYTVLFEKYKVLCENDRVQVRVLNYHAHRPSYPLPDRSLLNFGTAPFSRWLDHHDASFTIIHSSIQVFWDLNFYLL